MSTTLAAMAVAVLALAGCDGVGAGANRSDSAPVPATKSSAVPAPSDDPAGDSTLAPFYGQKLSWSACDDGFECTKATVPVDWNAPSGKTMTLRMTRLKARDTKKRLGSLFMNPGGPGVPGVPFAQAIAPQMPRSIKNVYDLVSWDTRGTGESTPVACLANDQLDAYYAMDGTPDDDAELKEALAATDRYVAACQRNTDVSVLQHMDTISTVRDMDLMRALVGDQQLTYFGASYGTFLGAWYAEEFPWRVGRLVLDGAVDPSLDSAGAGQAQAMGFARAVEAYVKDCLGSRDCPLRGTPQDAYSQIERLLRQADAAPLKTNDPKRPLTEALMTTGMILGMYSESYWPAVTEGISSALVGDGTMLLNLADTYLERDDNGAYGQTLQAYTPIYCLDHAEKRSIDQIEEQAQTLAEQYPPFGESMGWGGISCLEWPYEAVVPTQRITAEGAAPILVVGTTGDPATPYESAVALADQLSSGHLLTRVGEGHTGYLQGSVCVDDAINAYLLSGTLPAKGLRCNT